MTGLKYPVKLKDIEKFESQNNISVNVFAWDKQLIPKRISRVTREKERHVNLLYITDKNSENAHYVAIKDINTLVYSSTLHKEKKSLCNFCLNYFSSNQKLQHHQRDCIENKAQVIEMPDVTDKYIEFSKICRL